MNEVNAVEGSPGMLNKKSSCGSCCLLILKVGSGRARVVVATALGGVAHVERLTLLNEFDLPKSSRPS